MKFEIDFNYPAILHGHLNQALPQIGLEELAERFVVGSEGGLAYKLFSNHLIKEVPIRIKSTSFREINANKQYYNAVEAYIQDSQNHAKRYEFGLVYVGEKRVIFPGINCDEFIYNVSIGSINIKSLEKFRRFLEMMKSGREYLDKGHAEVLEKAKQIKR